MARELRCRVGLVDALFVLGGWVFLSGLWP